MSEETKKTEIYGNMYECLKLYKTLSVTQLKKDITFDDKARMVLLHDTKRLMERIKNEWYAKSSFEIANVETHCQLCGRKNVYICYIVNRINGEELHVGSDCVKKYKDINGADGIILKVNSSQRDLKKDARQSDFDVALGENIDFVKNATNKIQLFPMLLPYKLYGDLNKAVITCKRIRSSYITSGGNLYEHINKFNIQMEEFYNLYEKAEMCYERNKNNPLLCTRKIADWLSKNGYQNVSVSIQKSNGILTEETLQYIFFPDFVEKNIFVFAKCMKQKDVTFLGVEGSVIRFKIQNDRFRQPIFFTMSIKDFMKRIGCYCLTQEGYRYGKNSLSPSIEMNSENIKNVYNYYLSVLKETDYTLIIEQRVSQYYWEKRQSIKKLSNWSNHVRKIAPIYKAITVDRLLSVMGYVLFQDEKSKQDIARIIINKINMNGKWITKEEKDKGVKIALEAAGMQRQREFIPYV